MKLVDVSISIYPIEDGEKISEFLMKHGADLISKSQDGMTPLHRSIQMGKRNYFNLKKLFEIQADIVLI